MGKYSVNSQCQSKGSLHFFLVWLHQTRIGLSLYDVAGQGYLKESVRIVHVFYVSIQIFICLYDFIF